MSRIIWLPLAFVAFGILLWSPSNVNCQAVEVINSFEVNWNAWVEKNAKKPKTSAFSPEPTKESNFSWVASSFGACMGCGRTSYKAVTHDCVHKLPMKLTIGNYTKSLMGVFKVPDSECVKRNEKSLAPVNVLGCGPPCSDLRLLRGKNTGCRCDTEKKLAYDVPELICQDNRNRTVSLSLCKFIYANNVHDYHVVGCDYSIVCNSQIDWIAGNWTQCSDANSMTQTREVVCAAQSPIRKDFYFVMHDSMCLEKRPAKMQFCARWTAERHFKCNCRTRIASRRSLCMREFQMRRKRPVNEQECGWHDKPTVIQPCTARQMDTCVRTGKAIVG